MPSPLRVAAIVAIPSQLDGATLEELWDVENGWRWDLFAELLPSNIVK